MIRVEIHEEKVDSYATADTRETMKWVEVLSTITDDQKVAAGVLRAIADKYDPPGDGKVYR
jgi:hypothetical protein